MVIDGDSHILEPRDTWSGHIDPSFRDRSLRIVDSPVEVDGIAGYKSTLAIGDRLLFDVAGFMPLGITASSSVAELVQRDADSIDERDRLAAIRECLVPYEESAPRA